MEVGNSLKNFLNEWLESCFSMRPWRSSVGTQDLIVHSLSSPAVLACPEPAKQSEAE